MKIKQTILLIGLFIAVSLALVTAPEVMAASCGDKDNTSIIDCGEGTTGGAAIMWILKLVISIMTFGVGILAVIGIVVASIMYASAGGAPDQVKKAKTIILNVVIGLILYAFMFAITNFLIPGGVFNDGADLPNATVRDDNKPVNENGETPNLRAE